MRKLLLRAVCAVTILALSLQQAQAWKNITFGAGVNFAWQSGGTSIGWGLFRSAQPPGPDHGFGGGHFGGGYPGPVGPGHFDAPAPVLAPLPAPAPTMPHGHAYHYGQQAPGNVVYYNTPGYQPYRTVNFPYYPATYYYGR